MACDWTDLSLSCLPHDFDFDSPPTFPEKELKSILKKRDWTDIFQVPERPLPKHALRNDERRCEECLAETRVVPGTACLKELPSGPFRWCLEHEPRDGRRLNMPYCVECTDRPRVARFGIPKEEQKYEEEEEEKKRRKNFEWCEEHRPKGATRVRKLSNGPFCGATVERDGRESLCCRSATHGLNGRKTWCIAHAPLHANRVNSSTGPSTCSFCLRHGHGHGMKYARLWFERGRFPHRCTPSRCKRPAINMHLPSTTEPLVPTTARLFCGAHLPKDCAPAREIPNVDHALQHGRGKHFCPLCQRPKSREERKETLDVRDWFPRIL